MNTQGTNYNMVNMMKMPMQPNTYNQQYIRPTTTMNNTMPNNYNQQYNMNNQGMMMNNNYKPPGYQQQPPQNYQGFQQQQQPMQNYQGYQQQQQPMQNYQGFQQQMKPPTQTAFFVVGRIGNKIIAQEDRQSFMNNLKDTNWTQNTVYKNSKNAQVKTTFVPKQANNYTSNEQTFAYASFNKYCIELEPALNNFNSYLNDIQQAQTTMQEAIQSKKNMFISNIQGETDMDINLILHKIKQNRSYILSKDEQLYKSVANILPFIVTDTSTNQQQQQQPQQQQLQQPQQMSMIPNNNNNNMYYGNTGSNNNMSVPHYNY